MRNIKYSLLFIAVALFSIAASSCQKDSATLKARFSSFVGDSKVYVDNFAPIWNGDEEVVINNNRYQVSTVAENGSRVSIPGVLTAAVYNAVYPADFFPNGMQYFQVPRVQEYVVDDNDHQLVKAPMGAYCTQANPDLVFTPMGSLLRIKVSNNTGREQDMMVDSVSVEADAVALWGEAQVNDLDQPSRNFTFRDNESCHRAVVARLGADRSVQSMEKLLRTDEAFSVYAFVPSIPSTLDNKFTITVYAHIVGDNSAVVYSYTKSQSNAMSGTIPTGHLAQVPFSMSSDIETEIRPFNFEDCLVPGEFYVSQTKKVRFSKGNLQYQASTNTWRFADHQYDFVGGETSGHDVCGNVFESGVRCRNNFISPTYSGWIDLFGFAASGVNESHNPYHTGTADYVYLAGLPTGSYNTLVNDYYSYDWGYNRIINGGNQLGLWRTLTLEEWDYLLGHNTYGLGTISVNNEVSVYGLIIVPGTGNTAIEPGYSSGYATNVFYLESWNSLESNGAVFLPAAGCRRNGTAYDYAMQITNIYSNIELYYWTSSFLNTSSYHEGYCIKFYHESGHTNFPMPMIDYPSSPAHLGHSVRLCMDVQ